MQRLTFALACAVYAAAALLPEHFPFLAWAVSPGGDGVLGAMVIGSIRAQAKSVEQLMRQVKPASGDLLEAYVDVLYHRRQYVSGTTTTLTFFNAVGTPDITNMDTAGQLNDPQFFEVWGAHFDVVQRVTNTAEGITGAMDNVEQLVRSGGGTFTVLIGSKNYGPYLLLTSHALGGPTGNGWALDAVAAGGTPSQTVYANNGLLGYGINQHGGLTIPPKQKINVIVTWPAAVTLTGNTDVIFSLSGVRHREVK